MLMRVPQTERWCVRGAFALLCALMLVVMASSPALAQCTDDFGDLNGDSNTNVVDTQCAIIVALWDIAGQIDPLPACASSAEAGDLSCDGNLNVVDVQLFITLALGGTFSPALDSDNNGCPDACELIDPECGNGVVEFGEECDDGNETPGDGCENDCTLTPSDVVSPTMPGQVLITEFLANPSAVGDSDGEWVELHNPNAFPIDIAGLTLSDDASDFHFISPDGTPVVIDAGGYAILARNGDMAVNGGVMAAYQYDSFFLGNGGDEIIIAAGSEILDAVFYEGWEIPNGASLSLDTESFDATANDMETNWCAGIGAFGAGDEGTPGMMNADCGDCGNGIVEGSEQCDNGMMNSDTEPDACRTDCTSPFCGDGVADPANGETCDDGNDTTADGCEPDCTDSPTGVCGDGTIQFPEECDDGGTEPGDGCAMDCTFEDPGVAPGDLIVTEIMNNPSADFTVADSDGEWLEIHNSTSADVNLLGFTIRDAEFDGFVVDMGVVVPANGYVVIGINADMAVNGGVAVDYVWPEGTFFLSNSSDEVIIEVGGVVIDEVAYDDSMGWPDFAGASLSLQPTALDAVANDDVANWCAGSTPYGLGDFGSPGMMNPACPICGDGLIQGVELCDDGNNIPGDGCEADCTFPAGCGNGVVDAGEECDDGALNSDTTPDACRTDCTDPVCGDGVVDPANAEECDGGEDCNSNCTFPVVGGPEEGDVIITEIMNNPSAVSDSDGEWFEVYNTTDEAIDLDSMIFTEGDGSTPVTVDNGGPLMIMPGAYLVFGLNADEATNGGVTVDYVYSGFTLGNGSDEIVLVLGANELDRVEYDNGATFPDPTGFSMNLDPSAFDFMANNNGANWCFGTAPYGAGDLGTPGAANTACEVEPPAGVEEGDIIITEIHNNPGVVSDSVGEWFEVYNTTDAMIDLDGLVVSETDATPESFAVDNGGPLMIGPGEYLVFGDVADSGVNGGVTVDYEYTSFSFGNSADSIALTLDDVELDRVEFSDDTFPGSAGAALNLDPASFDFASNDMGANWCDATVEFGIGDFGTPGAMNTACEVDPPPTDVVEGDIIITEIMQNPSEVGDTSGEWLELYNLSDATIDIDGLVFAEADGSPSVTLDNGGPLMLAPGAYFVAGPNPDMATNGGVAIDFELDGFNLSNGGDSIVIILGGVELDRVEYDGGPIFPDPNGSSMSLDPSEFNFDTNDNGLNWCEGSTAYGDGDLGTPGAANPPCPVCGNGIVESSEECDNGMMNSDTMPDACRSNCTNPSCGDGVTDPASSETCDDGNFESGDGCEPDCTDTPDAECGDGIVDAETEACDDGNLAPGDGCSDTCTVEGAAPMPGDLIITEFNKNPTGNDQPENSEWIEVYNASLVDVNLLGVKLQDLDSDATVIDAPVLVASGGYAVLASNDVLTGTDGQLADYTWETLTYFLSNSADEIVLLTPDDVVIDAVEYDNGVEFPNTEGASAQLSFDQYDSTANDDGANWCDSTTLLGSATTDTGTPGADNEVCAGPAPTFAGDIQAIITSTACSTCHNSGNGFCTVGLCLDQFGDYAKTPNNTSACGGLTMAECVLSRVQDGSMPTGGTCTGDPATETNPMCWTQEEQDTFQAWIDAGTPE